MDESHERAVIATNRLIQVCTDCESVLRTAAEVAETTAARERYIEHAATWGEFCAALQSAVQDLGGVPPKSPGVAGTLQRAWIKIKSAIGDAAAIAAECSKREADALRRCGQAVENELPPSVREIVDRFRRQVAEQQRARHVSA